jgi:hypothetical protein
MIDLLCDFGAFVYAVITQWPFWVAATLAVIYWTRPRDKDPGGRPSFRSQ